MPRIKKRKPPILFLSAGKNKIFCLEIEKDYRKTVRFPIVLCAFYSLDTKKLREPFLPKFTEVETP